MSAPRASNARLPFIAAAALLALAACILLLPGGRSGPQAPAAAPAPANSAAIPGPGSVAAPVPAAQPTDSTPTAETPSPSASPGAKLTAPPDLLAGDMPDSYLQQVLDQTQLADLDPALEKQLVDEAGQVLLADLTGQGRAAFPSYFAGQSATTTWTQVRLQAGIARRRPGGSTNVDVHLVYAGTDPHGLAQERQTITIVLAQASGDSGWQPVSEP
ncbi:hypothetical protein [Kitasatospora cinereorecta]|uniref:Uncharacterized protein n=1 Tax=Kitasatospora cinereorecta TaxID=285560 RepID=A0ABW0VP96_9ACTN